MNKVLSLPQKKKALVLLQANRLNEAKALYAEICRAYPRDAEAWFLLGAVHGMLGAFDEAIACCRHTIAIQPDHADAYYNLAQAFLHQDRQDEAIAGYREVLRLNPRYLAAYINLGTLLQSKKMLDEAIVCFRQALRIQPNLADAHYNLGNALKAQGNYAAAAVSYREALRVQPDNAGTLYNLGIVLNDQGLHEAAIECYRQALRFKPDYAEAHGNLLFTLNYSIADEPGEVFAEHRRWEQVHTHVLAARGDYGNRPDPERRLRVGYVSPDLRYHSVAFFLEPLLGNHESAAVEVFCYADVSRPDAVTERLRGLSGQWRSIHGLPPAQVAEMIRADGIDILVDLAGHSGGNRLMVFARQPAPVQVTYLGYPNTTGLSAVDYRLTDAWADPPGETERWHTETLVRLPQGFLCYQPPAESPPVAPLPAHHSGSVVFGSFNALTKINTQVIAAWARILRAVPNSRLVLKNMVLRDAAVGAHYQDMFVREGLSRERVELIGWISDPSSHLELYNRVDLALDTFPYNGTTTTCEALWMGVPVITLAGRTHAGRVGVSLLSRVGLAEFVAANADDYVARAVHWANDLAGLAQRRAELRDRMARSALCDGPAFAREVENAYREMWRKWCAAMPGPHSKKY